MIRLLLLGFLIISGCQDYNTSETDQQETGLEAREKFFQAFSSPNCINPCWLGIEVGITSREDAITILEEQDIEYGVPGVIHLYSVPEDTVPGIKPEGIPSAGRDPNVFGDINVGQRNSDVVQSIDFFLDLCVETIVEAYGVPGVWFMQQSVPSTLVYLDHQMFFSIDPETQRIDWVILHMKDAMPSAEELEVWSEYANVFGECSDIFSEDQG